MSRVIDVCEWTSCDTYPGARTARPPRTDARAVVGEVDHLGRRHVAGGHDARRRHVIGERAVLVVRPEERGAAAARCVVPDRARRHASYTSSTTPRELDSDGGARRWTTAPCRCRRSSPLDEHDLRERPGAQVREELRRRVHVRGFSGERMANVYSNGDELLLYTPHVTLARRARRRSASLERRRKSVPVLITP